MTKQPTYNLFCAKYKSADPYRFATGEYPIGRITFLSGLVLLIVAIVLGFYGSVSCGDSRRSFSVVWQCDCSS